MTDLTAALRRGTKRAPRANPAKRVETARAQLRRQPNARVALWQELASLLRDFDLPHALEIVRDSHFEINSLTGQPRRSNDIVAIAADTWAQRVRNGESFADAIQGWASSREQMMISVGQHASVLGDVLKRMAVSEKTLQRLKNAWTSSLRQPLFLIVLSWIMVPGYAYFLLWQLGQYPEIHNATTNQAKQIAEFLLYYASWLVPVLVTGVTLWLAWVSRAWFSPRRPDFEHLWPLNLIKALNATDFLLALTTLKFAGYDESRALIAMRQVSTPYLRWQIDALEHNARTQKWGDALAMANRRFPAPQENALMGIFSLNSETYPQQLELITADWIVKLEERMESNRKATVLASMILTGVLQGLSSLLVMATALPV